MSQKCPGGFFYLVCKDTRVQGFELNAEELQRIEGLVKILSALFACLADNGKICERGKIRSDIAGSYGRKTTADYIRSLYIADGSNCELETQILLSADLGYIESAVIDKIKDEIQQVERMLKALIKTLEHKHYESLTP